MWKHMLENIFGAEIMTCLLKTENDFDNFYIN